MSIILDTNGQDDGIFRLAKLIWFKAFWAQENESEAIVHEA